jgi:hypothetical protein
MFLIYYYGELYRRDWEAWAITGCVCGMGIFWIIPLMMLRHQDKKDNKPSYNVTLVRHAISDEAGIQFIKDGYGNGTIIYYNIPDEDYAGKIDVDIRKVDMKTMTMIINKLEAWGNAESIKNARIRAYKDTRL